MKKILFVILLFFIYISLPQASELTFEIDVDKIKIDEISSMLINKLDSNYNIDTDDFSKVVKSDQEIIKLSEELIKISLGNYNLDEKKSLLTNYMIMSDTNGFDTLNASMFIKMYLEELSQYKIEYNYVKIIRTVSFEEGILAFAYLPNVKIDNEVKDLVLTFWFKENNGEYKLYFPWYSIDTDLEEYFNKVSKNEESGSVVGSTYKKLALSTNKDNDVDDALLNDLYLKNKENSLQITAMDKNGIGTYGSGFFIRKGIMVTTWSLFLQFLNNSNYIYVNDVNGNTYDILGVVSANTEYDVVVLKISDEIGGEVKFGNTNELNTDDKLFMINSKNNGGFSINYGSFISLENGRLKNLYALSSSDIGGALYNKNGVVMAFATGDIINSELSYANSTDYLIKLQNLLKAQSFDQIKYKTLEEFKNVYYKKYNNEKKYNNISDEELNNIKNKYYLNNINLDLIKSSSKDNIISLRYKNNVTNLLDTMYLINDYYVILDEKGFKLIRDEADKKVFINDKQEIIIKETFDYLIIIIMEL